MISDRTVSKVRPAPADAAVLAAAVGDLAGPLDLLVTSAEVIIIIIIIIAGESGALIRSLRASHLRAITLGDLQLGAALHRGTADWGTWGPDDMASGQIEAELGRLGSELAGPKAGQ